MPFKPLPPKKYRKYIGIVGWSLKKGSIDWNLFDENGKFVCSIKIMHGKGKVAEVSARSVKKTDNGSRREDGHGHQKRNKRAS